MGTTAKNLIKSAMKKVGIIAPGEEASPDELMDALTTMKQMIDTWSLEGQMIAARSKETFALTGAASYTIGRSADFDTVLPIEITEIILLDGAGNRFNIPDIGLSNYARVDNLSFVGRPGGYLYDQGYPISTIRFTAPTTDPQIVIWSKKPIEAWLVTDVDLTANPAFAGQKFPTSSFTAQTLDADIEFDLGFEQAIIYNLAIHLCPDYEKQPSPIVVEQAVRGKDLIKRHNLKIEPLRADNALLSPSQRYYDIKGGPR